jgi:hypothetical protein
MRRPPRGSAAPRPRGGWLGDIEWWGEVEGLDDADEPSPLLVDGDGADAVDDGAVGVAVPGRATAEVAGAVRVVALKVVPAEPPGCVPAVVEALHPALKSAAAASTVSADARRVTAIASTYATL